MYYAILKQVVEELAALLPGAKVDKVVQGTDGALLLVLHLKRRREVLLLSPASGMPRIHLLSHRPEGTGRPAGFFLQLRKHLAGSRIDRVGIVNDDRIVEVVFVKDGMSLRLLFELFGPRPNLVLTDASSGIIAVLSPLAPDEQGRRALLPGLVYEPPRTSTSPGKRQGKGLPSGDLGALGEAPANAAVERLYEKKQEELRSAAVRNELETALRRGANRVGRRIEAITRDLDEAGRAAEHRLRGELILANLGRLRTGMECAELTGPDGAAVLVPLDPVKGPAENAEAWFRRYKKAKAALAVVRERLDDAREEAEVIGLAQEELARTADSDRLAALRSRLATLGLIAGGGGGRTARPAAAAPYRTIDVDGWEVLVGTSAAGNDYLTMTIARPDDLWLHAEGMPGSHVVVRNPRRADVPPAVLKRAASLAAWYSKGRGATKVPVAYTAAKYVRKPRGARAGAVVLAERKTIMAAPEPFH